VATRAAERWLGLGCMRLSTAPDRDEEAAAALLRAAFDAGVDFLDTADAYCHDEREAHHNERLVRRALASWGGDLSRVRVATKGGLTRPGGRWVADGRARHLREACAASREALGVERIFLYQLHAPDPRVPLATSVRALDALRREGLVERVGLSNVSLRQLEDALRIARIDAVQVELSLLRDDALWSGLVGRCVAEDLRVVAYRPLGGPDGPKRLSSEPLLQEIAQRLSATPAEVALAWLRDLSPLVVPIPGATRTSNVLSCVRAAALALGVEDRARLDERFPGGRMFREGPTTRRPAPAGSSAGEVVLVMGIPGAGKSRLADALVREGYERLNRDERGGRLVELLPALDAHLAEGRTRVVLDNTYATRKSRAAVVATAAKRGVGVRCVWLDTKLEDAQVNAVRRMLARHGRLLEPSEMSGAVKDDPGAFPPRVLFRYQRDLQPPDPSEGFARIDVVPFERALDASLTRRALVVWLDGVLWRSRSGQRTPAAPEDLELVPGRADVLRRHAEGGRALFGLSWRPDVAEGRTSHATVAACVAELRRELELPMEVSYCAHAAGPPVCWCRKPLPGLGVELIEKHRLDPAGCLYVGASSLDRSFAARLGFVYREADELFGSGSADAG
jgi:aryl-alcohol dehydrogenase-like predicted oxidoreductase/histidinol phosphatase-like enzyme